MWAPVATSRKPYWRAPWTHWIKKTENTIFVFVGVLNVDSFAAFSFPCLFVLWFLARKALSIKNSKQPSCVWLQVIQLKELTSKFLYFAASQPLGFMIMHCLVSCPVFVGCHRRVFSPPSPSQCRPVANFSGRPQSRETSCQEKSEPAI